MFLTVRLTRGASDVLVVPEETLVPEQGDVFVFVVTAATVEKAQVRTGQRRVGDVQVVAGLAVRRAGRHRRHAEAARRRTGGGAGNAAPCARRTPRSGERS